MQRFAVVLAVGDQRFPGLRLVQRAGFNRLADELCALGVDLPAAERVVTDFAVSHVVVGGKTDGGAVRLEPRHGARRHELVEIRGVCLLDCVAAAAVAASDTVHDDQYNGFLHLYILHTCWFLFIRAYFTSFRSGLQCQFSVCSRKICSFARA